MTAERITLLSKYLAKLELQNNNMSVPFKIAEVIKVLYDYELASVS